MPPLTCLCLRGRQKRSLGTRAFPPRWYTRRGSHNREVTRVKKDVRVNLARCISGDELIPPISLWPLHLYLRLSLHLALSLFSLLLCLSLFFSCLLLFPPAKCAIRLFPPPSPAVPPLHLTAILLSGPWLRSLVSHHPLPSFSLSMADLTNLENHVSRDVY